MTETDRERHEEEARRRRRRARKERVLHTRISEDLAEDIRRMAEELRVPVSNIVRNVLEEAFSVVETVSDNVGDLIEDVVDEAEAAARRIRQRQRRGRRRGARWDWLEEEPLDAEPAESAGAAPEASPAPAQDAVATGTEDEILGWQPLVLAREQRCSDCGSRLERGASAHAGVTSRGIGASYLCEGCLGARR